MLINNQIIVESVQSKLQELTQDDPVENIDMIQRLSSSLKDIIERNLQLGLNALNNNLIVDKHFQISLLKVLRYLKTAQQ